MKPIIRKTAAFGVALVLGLTACAELDVVNPNAADTNRALGTPGDIESLVAGSFRSWWVGSHHYDYGPPILANQTFQMASWPANFGMVDHSTLPRGSLKNLPTDQYYREAVAGIWIQSYRALAAVAEGLKALEDPVLAGQINVARARAFGKFVQGMAHGSLALLYNQAWIIDETTQTRDAQGFAVTQPLRSHNDVMAAALGYFQEAIDIATGASFTIPAAWISVATSEAQLIRLAHSMRARYAANVARTPAERAAVNWAQVIADVDAGVTTDWNMTLQFFAGNWWNGMVGQFSNPTTGWAQMSYQMHGMADQSGMYQDWLSAAPASRLPNWPDNTPRLIITPDLRFPQGATVAAQRADVSARRRQSPANYGTSGSPVGTHYGDYPYMIVGHLNWSQPARGTFRWSYYRHGSTDFHRFSGSSPHPVPEVTMQEMNLLKAEGLFRQDDLAGAATLINLTREAAGLNATDAAGTNTSCVPKLPDESCGGLFEMLKWEKRMETAFFGIHANSWFFDGRGWGDLYAGTPLERPVPCLEMQIVGDACTTTGGGQPSSAPVSTYNFPHEG